MSKQRAVWTEGMADAMNIEYLNEFFVLAYRLNFSAAAKELHVSQPVLSRHIASLEKELGAVLFDRDSQDVSLTLAGEACLEDVNNILSDYNSLLRHAHRFGSGSERKVIIQTYTDIRYIDDYVHAAEASLASEGASVEIELRSLPRSNFFGDVCGCDVDLVLALSPHAPLPEVLEEVELSDEPLAAFVPGSSPFADRETISVRELEGQTLVVSGLLDDHEYANGISKLLRSFDVQANIVEHYYGTVYGQLQHIGKNEMHIDVLCISYNMTPIMAQDCKVLRFEEQEMSTKSVAVFRRDNENPWLGMVVDELRRLMGAGTLK